MYGTKLNLVNKNPNILVLNTFGLKCCFRTWMSSMRTNYKALTTHPFKLNGRRKKKIFFLNGRPFISRPHSLLNGTAYKKENFFAASLTSMYLFFSVPNSLEELLISFQDDKMTLNFLRIYFRSIHLIFNVFFSFLKIKFVECQCELPLDIISNYLAGWPSIQFCRLIWLVIICICQWPNGYYEWIYEKLQFFSDSYFYSDLKIHIGLNSVVNIYSAATVWCNQMGPVFAEMSSRTAL